MVSLPTGAPVFRLTASSATRPHGPTRAALGRVAAYHSDDPLFLAVIEYGRRAGALLFVERRFQAALPVAMANFANGLRSEGHPVGNPPCATTLGQLQ